MATLIQPRSEEEIRKIGVANVRKAYKELSDFYMKIVDKQFMYCHYCDNFLGDNAFYTDSRFKSGYYPICKKCLLKMATDYDEKTRTYTDNKEKTIKVFKLLDLPFIEALYDNATRNIDNDVAEKQRGTAYQHVLTMVKSLGQYRNKTFKDSDYSDNTTVEMVSTKSPRKEIIKLFGSGFTNEEYLFLQDQYDDWRARTQVDSKSQETYIIRICSKLLEIWNAQKRGNDTTKLDESLNKLMDAAKLQPKQNINNAATDSLSLGELIERWETEKPIPEVDPALRDVDKIGKYIRVWFTGWISKVLGLKTSYTKEFEEEIKKYEVTTDDNQENSETISEIYQEIFGSETE